MPALRGEHLPTVLLLGLGYDVRPFHRPGLVVRRLSLPSMLALVAACAPGEAEPPAAWRPGAVLLDELPGAVLEVDVDLPPALVAGGASAFALHEVRVGARDWARGGVVDAAAAALLDVSDSALLWEAAPWAPLDLGGERPGLEHEGRALQRQRLPGHPNVWRDDATGHVFLWGRGDGLLSALGPVPPGDARLVSGAPDEGGTPETDAASDPTPSAAPVRHSGSTPAPAPAPTRDAAPSLSLRLLTAGRETRPALVLPAPSHVELPAREVHASALLLAVHVPVRVAARDELGRLVRRREPGLALELSVTAIADGRRDVLLREVVTAADAYRELEVDLSPVRGRRVALELAARPLRALGGFTPFVAWADGQFAGVLRGADASPGASGDDALSGAPGASGDAAHGARGDGALPEVSPGAPGARDGHSSRGAPGDDAPGARDGHAAPDASPGAPGARGDRPHVVLVSLDTLRADRLGCYGHARDTSPRIDAWAARTAVVFDDAVSDSNWTLPSTASLLTGLATRQHGVLAYPAELPADMPTLASRLRAAGWHTVAFTEGGFVSPSFGLAQGFDLFVVQPTQASDWAPALRRLAERGDDRPVFLFLHTYGVHSPWPVDDRFADPDAPYAGALAGVALDDDLIARVERGELPIGPAEHAEFDRRYDAAVRRVDDQLGVFLEQLDALVEPADRLVLVTSDHGEHLFEHGHVTHGHSLYGSVLRVPLLVSWPGGAPVGRASVPAAGVDLAPTVLDVLRLARPADWPGRSLREARADPVLRVSQHGGDVHAVQLGPWKLVTARMEGRGAPREGVELFRLDDDPGELHERSGSDAERVRALTRALDEWLLRHPPRAGDGDLEAELDAEAVAELRALGYLGDR